MTMKSTLDVAKLQSFGATDFLSWKLYVQLGMKEREIFYIVLSNFATTREDVDEYQWSKDENFCRNYLLNSLNSRLALTYRACKTAKEIWDRVHAHFQFLELEIMRHKFEDEQSETVDNPLANLILSKLPPKQNTANMVVDTSDPKSFVAMIESNHRSASSEWWLDSGATCHVTNDRGLLSEVRAVRDRIENCNGGETVVTHAGTAKLVLSSEKVLWRNNTNMRNFICNKDGNEGEQYWTFNCIHTFG